MYSVRHRFESDPEGSIQDVAKMGYEVVEIYSPYFKWTPEKLKSVRKTMDDSGVKCLSTHNGSEAFAPENFQKAIDLNGALGSRYIVLASPGTVTGLDGWKQVAATLARAQEKFGAAKMSAAYHNHTAEFKEVDGQRPMEVIAAGTPKSVMLQLDVGHCFSTGADPVAWINANPGRIRSLHLKDWSPELQLKALFGQGTVPWKNVFAAAEKAGGVEFYLIEQEDAPDEFEAVKKCIEGYRRIHG